MGVTPWTNRVAWRVRRGYVIVPLGLAWLIRTECSVSGFSGQSSGHSLAREAAQPRLIAPPKKKDTPAVRRGEGRGPSQAAVQRHAVTG